MIKRIFLTVILLGAFQVPLPVFADDANAPDPWESSVYGSNPFKKPKGADRGLFYEDKVPKEDRIKINKHSKPLNQLERRDNFRGGTTSNTQARQLQTR